MDTAPNLLIFAPYFHPPTNAESIATLKLVLAVREAGWGATVIAERHDRHAFPDVGSDFWEPARATMVAVSGSGGGWAWAWRAARVARRLAAVGRFTHLVTRAAPQYGHLPALLLRGRLGLPWIAHWSDPMPPAKAPPPYGAGTAARLHWPSAEYLRRVVAGADQHVFPCRRLLEYFARYAPGIAAKGAVLPHVALRTGWREAASGAPGPRVCYAGSLAGRSPKVFLEGLALHRERTPAARAFTARFLAAPRDELAALVAERGLGGCVSIEAPVGYEATLAAIRAAAAGLIIEAPVAEGIFLPSKLSDIVQSGRPVLALSPQPGTVADLVARHGGGIAVRPDDPAAVTSALGLLADAWWSGTLDAEYRSEGLMAAFGAPAVVSAYQEILGVAARDAGRRP